MEAVHVSLIHTFIKERMLLIREMAVKTHSLINYYTSITKNRRGIIQAMNNKNWSWNVLRNFFFSHWYFSPFFVNSGCCPSSSSMCLLNSWSVLTSPHRSYIKYNLWKHTPHCTLFRAYLIMLQWNVAINNNATKSL